MYVKALGSSLASIRWQISNHLLEDFGEQSWDAWGGKCRSELGLLEIQTAKMNHPTSFYL